MRHGLILLMAVFYLKRMVQFIIGNADVAYHELYVCFIFEQVDLGWRIFLCSSVSEDIPTWQNPQLVGDIICTHGTIAHFHQKIWKVCPNEL
ncbi:hypothetical protein RIF29_41623 [Crotalaria pallida]|uniref:Secreted protein n=1 Tax=Crotalaria pallida TaxID=3830 RepID=A0AAN9HVH6_CROPI